MIPETLDKWNIEDLNRLVSLRDIESEQFDFKGPEFKELANHFCAFANYSTGQMVLGVKEDKRNGHLVGFKKVGFNKEREDWVRNEVNNAMANVDPPPEVNIKRDHDSIYPVLTIVGKDIRKPYGVRGSGQFFIRIGAATVPASRTVVLNLFSNLQEKQNILRRFLICVGMLKESIMFVTESLQKFGVDDIIKIAPIDLSLIKRAIPYSEWFLVENDLLGGHIETNYIRSGLLYSYLQELEVLNIYINAYNIEFDRARKSKLKTYMVETQYWHPESDKVKEFLRFLKAIEYKVKEFLLKS